MAHLLFQLPCFQLVPVYKIVKKNKLKGVDKIKIGVQVNTYPPIVGGQFLLLTPLRFWLGQPIVAC